MILLIYTEFAEKTGFVINGFWLPIHDNGLTRSEGIILSNLSYFLSLAGASG
jgi:hypothetical protein